MVPAPGYSLTGDNKKLPDPQGSFFVLNRE
jgi:hypothetical protein